MKMAVHGQAIFHTHFSLGAFKATLSFLWEKLSFRIHSFKKTDMEYPFGQYHFQYFIFPLLHLSLSLSFLLSPSLIHTHTRIFIYFS